MAGQSAVAGRPSKIDYDADDERLAVSYRASPEVTAPTEIYLPESFGEGGDVDCGDCQTTWNAESRILEVAAPAGSGEHSIVVTVK